MANDDDNKNNNNISINEGAIFCVHYALAGSAASKQRVGPKFADTAMGRKFGQFAHHTHFW